MLLLSPILVKLLGARNGLQPGLAALDPEFVGGGQSGRGFVQCAEFDLHFLVVDRKKPRPTSWAKLSAFPLDSLSCRLEVRNIPNTEESKCRSALLATIGAMADPDIFGLGIDLKADFTSPATSKPQRHFDPSYSPCTSVEVAYRSTKARTRVQIRWWERPEGRGGSQKKRQLRLVRAGSPFQ